MPDLGFRVLKLDSSNMSSSYYSPSQLNQSDLLSQITLVKLDRSSQDLLFQILLELGLTLDVSIAKETFNGFTFYNVEDNFLLACFDDELSSDLIVHLAKNQPQYIVIREKGANSDYNLSNFEQLIYCYSCSTILKIF